VTQLDYFIEG